MKERINTPSSELQLKRGILGLEHRLDEMDLISETSQPVTWLCFHEEADSFWHDDHCPHPTRPQAKLEKICTHLLRSKRHHRALGRAEHCILSVALIFKVKTQAFNLKTPLSDHYMLFVTANK